MLKCLKKFNIFYNIPVMPIVIKSYWMSAATLKNFLTSLVTAFAV